MDSATIIDRYYNLSLRFLSYRPRSEKELVDYLRKKVKSQKSKGKIESQNEKTIDDNLIDKIITKLKEYKFVDDREFARFWVEQRTKFKHKPFRVIEYELKQKGIDKGLIEEVMASFDDKNTFDLENAKKLAEKKLDFYRSLPPQKRQEKVMNYLLRKGFNYDIVKKALK